jgi:HEAT repeat protein
MEINELTEIVETMAEQHSYPGYDVRSLSLGLPESVTRASCRLFATALTSDRVLVKLAALRWFYERPGDAKRYVRQIAQVMNDADEWVRLEAVRSLGRVSKIDSSMAIAVSELLKDPDAEVRKAAAKSCGKLNCSDEQVLANLRQAALDTDTEVRWKAQKALRQLGAYVT